MPAPPRALPRLIALSPGDLCTDAFAAFLGRVERTLAAGLPGLLLREPRLSDKDILTLGRRLSELRRGTALWLALHDRAHLAGELGVDAVHLSFRSLAPEELRSWLEPRLQLGLSTHAWDDPERWKGADYLFHGPLHETPSKHGRSPPLGFAGLGRARERATCPVLALGGVTPADVPRLGALGLHGVATLSGVLGAADPGAATRAFLEALAGFPPA